VNKRLGMALKPSAFAVNGILGAVLIPILLSASGLAQTKSEELDKLFGYYNENGMFNGVVLAAEDGNVIYEKAFGFADFENKIPLETSSVFAIGSTTKPFTALAIMMLKERRLLSYNDRLIKYFPQFPTYAKPITIRHLLLHTSGIPDYLNDLNLMDNLHNLPEVTAQIALDNLIKQPALKSKPGEKFDYSNSNYLLLALIIEKVSGMNWGEFLKKNIFLPVGMNHTCAYDESGNAIPGRVNSYEHFNWEKVDRDLRCKSFGDGNIYSTVQDMLLFDQALYTEKLISQKTLQAAYDDTGLLDRRKYVYGFGWKISIDTPGRIISHNSTIGGFRCQFWRDLDKKNTLIILANNWWLSETPDILAGSENIMLGKPYKLGKIRCTLLFYENWYFKGFAAAMNRMREAKTNESEKYDFPAPPLNQLGYFFLEKKQCREAVGVFQFGVELYPDDFNLWDSLGEAYMTAGDKENAVKCYQKALELKPDLESAKEALKTLGAAIK